MNSCNALAIDMGTGSIRGMLGILTQDGIESVEEICRFENSFVRISGGVFWDYTRMYRAVLECLRECGQRGIRLDCIGIDSWGQDYAYVASNGEILGLPRCYRDPAISGHADDITAENGMDAAAHSLYSGASPNGISTMRQLWFDRKYRTTLFDSAKWILHIPHLMAYLLTGKAACDITLATMGELADLSGRKVSAETLDLLGVREKLPPLRKRGEILGYTNRSVFEETGYDGIPVIATEAHDTNSAVSAVPDPGEFLWVSSGSYNMLGAVVHAPLMDPQLYREGFFQVPMADGRICIMTGTGAGMYQIQQCMRYWKQKGEKLTYEELTDYALGYKSDCVFDFSALPEVTSDMPEAIRAAIRKTGQRVPENCFELYEVFCNSLSSLMARKLKDIESILERHFESLYVISGGAKAEAVNRRLAEETHKTVYAGLTEASAMGNLLAQWIGMGMLGENWQQAIGADPVFEMRKIR